MSQLGWSAAPSVEDPIALKRFLDDVLQVLKQVALFGENVMIMADPGTPEGVVTANVGSLFLRTDGGANTTLYVKESGTGNTGWVAK
jgi:hypothetical protein